MPDLREDVTSRLLTFEYLWIVSNAIYERWLRKTQAESRKVT